MKKTQAFEINTYRIDLHGGAGGKLLRIALVADLHNRACPGLIEALAAQQPDVIAIAGDLMESVKPLTHADIPEGLEADNPDDPLWKRAMYRLLFTADTLYGRIRGVPLIDPENRIAFAFLRQAVEIAPVYYGLGNHERFITRRTYEAIEATGATLVHNAYVRTWAGQCELIIGGLSSRRHVRWLEDFRKAGRSGGDPAVKVLLCHRPEVYDMLALPGDVILSGHVHGGQWRLFGRPVFAPGQGLFPRYAGGLYHGRLVVSRGLSNTAHVPRLGNPMELAIVEVWG